VAIEAQACGTPVVAADVGGLGTAVKNRETGLLVQGHRTDDWAAAIGWLLADREELTRMGERAHRHASNFSWERTAEGLLASYAKTSETYHGPARQQTTSKADTAPRMAWLTKLRRGVRT